MAKKTKKKAEKVVSGPAWPAETVEMVPVSDLVPYARNARTHTQMQVEQVAASIREWGWTVPILIDDAGGIIAGHCRVLAASKLGIEHVPAMVAVGWSEAQKRAYVIADNKLAENAGWDTELLKVELEGLQEDGFDLELMGFELGELNDILDTGDLSGEDDVAPPKPDDPVSRLGDVWLLGSHRLACGDSTDRDTVAVVLDGAAPPLMVTDPPYGVEYNPEWRNKTGVSATKRTGKVLNDDRSDWGQAWALFPGDIAYVWHGSLHAPTVLQSLERVGFVARSMIVWKKSRFALSRGAYYWHHESCLYAVRPDEIPDGDKDAVIAELQSALACEDYVDEHDSAWYVVRSGSKARWSANRRQSTWWDIPVTDDGDGSHHGTQKPLECMARAIRNHDTESVYEPFCGTGTTLIACELLGRACYAIELDPGYVDVAIARWEKRTGMAAVLEQTKDTFAEAAEARR
jgi:DNA modification methylase